MINWFANVRKALTRQKEQLPKRPEMREIASISLADRWSQYPTSNLTPARLRNIILGADAGSITEIAELFEEMEERDAHLAAILQTRKLAVQGLEYVIQPWDTEDRRAIEIADFCEHAIGRIVNFRAALYDILDAIGKGFSVTEINWLPEGNSIIIDSLTWIHPKKITFSGSLEPRLLTDTSPYDGIEFPPWKTLYFCYKARSGWDNRAGLLRVVALLFLLKNYNLKYWAGYNEIFGMPLRLGKYDPSASQADRDALYQAVQALGSDAAGIISTATEIEFVQATNKSADNPFLAMQQFCNNEMSKAILGQTLTTDTAGATGTYSAGKVHNQVRDDLLLADAMALGDLFTRQVLYPLVGFNFGWDAAKQYLPTMVFQPEEEEDLKLLSETYKNLLDAGVPIALSHIQDKFELPEIENGEVYIVGKPGAQQVQVSDKQGVAPQGTAPGTPSNQNMPQPTPADAMRAEALRAAVEWYSRNPGKYDKEAILAQAKIDRIVADAVEQSTSVTEMILRPLKDKIMSCKSLDQVQDVITDYYGAMDVSQLASLLYGAMMLSYFQGYEVD